MLSMLNHKTKYFFPPHTPTPFVRIAQLWFRHVFWWYAAIKFTDAEPRSADWKRSLSKMLNHTQRKPLWVEANKKSFDLEWSTLKHLHTTVGHGHGVIRRGITGDLTVIGTGGRCKNVARVDKVRAGGVSTSMGPAEWPGKHLQHVNVRTGVSVTVNSEEFGFFFVRCLF